MDIEEKRGKIILLIYMIPSFFGIALMALKNPVISFVFVCLMYFLYFGNRVAKYIFVSIYLFMGLSVLMVLAFAIYLGVLSTNPFVALLMDFKNQRIERLFSAIFILIFAMYFISFCWALTFSKSVKKFLLQQEGK